MAAELRRRLIASLRPLAREESGFTFPELIVAASLALITGATAMALLTVSVKTQPRVSERAAQIQQGRTMIERVTQELRQGETVFNPTSSGFQILTLVSSETCGGVPAPSGMPCRITYSCTATACTRTERDPDGGGTAPPEQLVKGITGPNVFSYSPAGSTDPSYVAITLSFPGDDGGEAVTLRDGVALRNYLEADTGV